MLGARVVSLVAVVDDNGRILLVRSARRPDRWELPGGAVEPNESPMDAARREVLEETGVQPARLELVGLYYGRKDALIRVVFSSLVSQPGPLRPRDQCEILEVAWFARDTLPHPMPSLARQMIEDASVAGSAALRTIEDDKELV